MDVVRLVAAAGPARDVLEALRERLLDVAPRVVRAAEALACVVLEQDDDSSAVELRALGGGETVEAGVQLAERREEQGAAWPEHAAGLPQPRQLDPLRQAREHRE